MRFNAVFSLVCDPTIQDRAMHRHMVVAMAMRQHRCDREAVLVVDGKHEQIFSAFLRQKCVTLTTVESRLCDQ